MICITDLKEAYRIFWIVKGHIAESDQTALDCYNGYFKRLWIDGSNGAPLSDYEEGFEIAWKKKLKADEFCLRAF